MARLTRGWYKPLARASFEENEEVELARFESSGFYSRPPGIFPIQYPLLWVTGGVSRRIRRRIFRSLLTVRGVITFLICTLLGLITFTFAFWPSYTHLPPHYRALQAAVQQSTTPGRGNPYNSTIFIAVSLYDKLGVLAGGSWGQSLLDLIDMLGPDRVHLSFPTVTLPDGSTHVRRVAYLAEVRNRALRPLQQQPHRFDRLLFLNDVYFNPVDALQLLFSMHSHDGDGPDYRAACAVDFINPFKFYDTFASRDLEGYSMGIPFHPWFTTAGKAHSRHYVLLGTDAVRVRSCWGGMVAFDAAFFQHDGSTNSLLSHHRGRHTPVQFRGEEDLFWEASECCLIHADIQRLPSIPAEEEEDTGIYMNPFVRVAYDPRSLSWLAITRRVERLYSPIHGLLSRVVGLPIHNPRRIEIPGRESQELVWDDNQGEFAKVTRAARPGGFCGRWDLQLLKPRKEDGEGGWASVPVPARSMAEGA
ncbi:hypothetical protein BO94DRAFT_583794 [Aspergillus sclerotioniger CBS 115572]|uniref:Glycosyltransferase family 69 protein n=1 Tax=Aspergillus sclerotioniger CBS 115572 TaxID=1450535 RepID=A0A317WZR1_9EURO|nr:hypothetical protein BO94DRAFT_583794 [Aspergillus sclerotioniger CBS 115572]PWY91874.1 hypothetical protein BO94DRAFT_583794 [Aspergillus sclerotioniger CBS 115572]